jgi:dihydrolipoamide dehydrogenase
LGAKVTVLEYADRILAGMDLEVANAAQKLFKRQGMDFKLGVRVTGATLDGESVVVTAADAEPIRCSHVLLAVGRKPNTQGLALETAGITPDARGQIPVDDHFRTTAQGVYAVGDVIHGPMLAHKAEKTQSPVSSRSSTGMGMWTTTWSPVWSTPNPRLRRSARAKKT